MENSRATRLGTICVFTVLILSLGYANLVPWTVAPTAGVVSATPASDGTCSGDVQRRARISQSSIQAVDDRITTDEPALISGQIVAPQSNQCLVVVQMILTIPTDMYVTGTDDVGSSGQGKLSATFQLSPGETRSMSAQVYASDPGTRVLVADFLYYPAGHPSDERQLSGFSIEIEAVEANMPGGNDDSEPFSVNDTVPIVSIGGLLVVGVLIWLFR